MKIKAQQNPPRHVVWGVASSPLGEAVVGVTDRGRVCRASFLRERNAIDIVAAWQMEWKTASFFMGAVPEDFTVTPLLMVGTDFQAKAWKEIMRIPRGQIASYGEIARRIGEPRASRAVGMACGKNHLAYIVPCHRVVSANGLGGYGMDGLAMKRKLLRLEGIDI